MQPSIVEHKIGKMSRSEAGKLGYIASIPTIKLLKEQRIQQYNLNPKLCEYCQSPLSYDDVIQRKVFCSRNCSAHFNNAKRITYNIKHYYTCKQCNNNYNSKWNKNFCSHSCYVDFRYNQHIKNWKSGVIKGWTGKTIRLNKTIRLYLFKKFQNKCCKCGWHEINPSTNNIPLEVNHIDGDATNCQEENLELICPNCHSLTPNFRNLNKNSKRVRNGAAVG